MVKIVLLAYDLTGMYKINHLIRYGDDKQEINDVVVLGTDKNGHRVKDSFKLASSQLKSLQPFHKMDILGERDHLTKLLFLEYLETHPDERFFQSVRNFSKIYLLKDANFIGYSEDNENYKDTFYLEGDELATYGEEDG